MTISTHRTKAGRRVSINQLRTRRSAFTLTEVLIASTLSVVVLAGVLGAFLFFGRTGLALGHYQEMETQLRRALEVFSEDVRMASDIRWTNSRNITLDVPAADGTYQPIAYSFTLANANALTGTLHRVHSDGRRELLVSDVANDFAFRRYKLEQPGITDNAAYNDLETKQLQLSLRTLHLTAGGPASTQAAVSARYILRNKRVSR